MLSLPCPECCDERPFDQPFCEDGHGLDCPEWLCTDCGERNYRVQKETRGAERLELKKYCPRTRKHEVHKESRKK